MQKSQMANPMLTSYSSHTTRIDGDDDLHLIAEPTGAIEVPFADLVAATGGFIADNFLGDLEKSTKGNCLARELHIIHSCLNLKMLRVRHCRLPSMLCVSGAARLGVLVVDACPGLEEIELNAINLTTFECCDSSMKKFSFSCVPKLEKMFFSRNLSCAWPGYFVPAASNLPQLKTLRISATAFWVREIVDNLYVFCALKPVQLFIIRDHGFFPVLIIAPLLRAGPLLQKLNVVMPLPSIRLDLRERVMEPPQDLSTRLAEVRIGGFSGTWDNIDFAIYLLKCTTSLKQIIIDSNYRFYMGCSGWVSESSIVWSTEICKRICDQLQGNNMSENTEIIIYSQ
ncbi:hypothetical protein RHMOL_Rhmol08G0243000 [Rhododendron molle]|uniref:Uncharacterized protein n=1 Tax=Rhododendron molle TaxID=49168 RepID=A0ACC0MT89_RHOML|nr:hypothetical protein RHMOL_Rhmol08G0243000 [Rhododendron molle]